MTAVINGRPAPSPEDLLGRGARAIVVAASRDPNAKVTVLLLREGSRRPVLAMKMPTSDAAAVAVRAETELLQELSGVLPLDLLLTVPRVVRAPDAASGALVTTAVAGTPMNVAYHRWRHVSHPSSVARDFQMAGCWLTRLQETTAVRRAPLELAADIVPWLELRFRGDELLDPALEVLDRAHRRLRLRTSPCTVVHGDFWHGNVLTRGGAVVGVIDWEAGTLRGPPVRDIARFALAYALYLDRHTRDGAVVRGHPGVRAGTWDAGVRSLLDGDGWFPELARGFVGAHLGRLGIGAEYWRDTLIAGIAETAVAADAPDFARRHLALLAGCGSRPRGAR